MEVRKQRTDYDAQTAIKELIHIAAMATRPAVLDAFKWEPEPLASAKVPRMSEAAFQEKVVDLATLMSWRTMHVYPLRYGKGVRTPTTSPGWPDLVMVRGYRMVAVELKAEGGRLTLAQEQWLAALGQVAGVEQSSTRRPPPIDAATPGSVG